MNCEVCEKDFGFRWTDSHGVGVCTSCGTPYTIYHYEDYKALADKLQDAEKLIDNLCGALESSGKGHAAKDAYARELESRLEHLLLPLGILLEFARNAGFNDYETLDKASDALQGRIVERQEKNS